MVHSKNLIPAHAYSSLGKLESVYLVLNIPLKKILVYSDNSRKTKLSPISLDKIKHAHFKSKTQSLVLEQQVGGKLKFYAKHTQAREEWAVVINDTLDVSFDYRNSM
jgi:hypothetical protein